MGPTLFRWTLCLLVLLVTLTGCIVRYQGFPDTTSASLPEGHNVPVLPAHPGFEQCELQPSMDVLRTRELYFVEGINLLNPLYWLTYPTMPGPLLSARSQRLQVPVQGGHVALVSPRNHAAVSPQDGLVCMVWINYQEQTGRVMEGGNVQRSGATWSLIPAYVPYALSYSVTFSVLNGEQLAKKYYYSFNKDGGAGIFVLPFAWINFFTTSQQDAVQAVFQQFLFDQQRDH